MPDLGTSQPTTPTAPSPHGVPPRGLGSTPSSSIQVGRFGRMFRGVPVFVAEAASLIALGEAMIQDLEDGKLDKALGVPDDDENVAKLDSGELRLPAGYTYFGQFVDHDITFDPASSLVRQNDPDGLTDFRTPRFDLDSLYGRGPADQPYLYQADGLHLALGASVNDDPVVGGPDLQRLNGRAVIGDPRNDENLIVSQLQVAFIQFHNAVVDATRTEFPNISDEDLFKEAQRRVRWHYQWIVVHDLLPRLVGAEVVDDLLQPEIYAVSAQPATASVTRSQRRFYHWRGQPFMPIEFSVAAYRYGHSMIRPSYLINDLIPVPVVDNAARIPLFSQAGGPLQNLNGFRPLPQGWGVQWKYFLPNINDRANADRDAHLPQPSYHIDTELSNPLGALPNATAAPEQISEGADPEAAQVLSVRNLIRAKRLGDPAGQDVARAMGIEPPLTDEQLLGDLHLDPAVADDLRGRWPLWFYVLREAEVDANKEHLGRVGGRIVAEVLVGLLDGDPLSFLSVQPNWTPTLPAKKAGRFTLSDLINFARPLPANVTPAKY